MTMNSLRKVAADGSRTCKLQPMNRESNALTTTELLTLSKEVSK